MAVNAVAVCWKKRARPGRQYTQLDVAPRVCVRRGPASCAACRHRGAKPGPTLGILTTIHGDETFPLMVVLRELLNAIDA